MGEMKAKAGGEGEARSGASGVSGLAQSQARGGEAPKKEKGGEERGAFESFQCFEPAELSDEQCRRINEAAPKGLTLLPHAGWP